MVAKHIVEWFVKIAIDLDGIADHVFDEHWGLASRNVNPARIPPQDVKTRSQVCDVLREDGFVPWTILRKSWNEMNHFGLTLDEKFLAAIMYHDHSQRFQCVVETEEQ